MLPTDPWPETVARARHLEASGYDHLWTYDHLSWRRYRERPWFGAIPWLTGIAAATDRIRLGPLVSSPNFRHPVTLAKDAMTLDHVSGGRLILGVGAGGLGFDSTVLGNEPLTPARLASRLDEFVEVLDRLLREPAVSHTGEHYTVHEARMIPGCVQQPRVPLAIAAGGAKTLRTVARSGDAWVTYGPADPDATAVEIERTLRLQSEALERACAAIGRDAAGIDRIYLMDTRGETAMASGDAFADFASRQAALGVTDLVVHHPRAGDPVWDYPPEIIDEIAALLPTLHAV